MTTKQKSTAQKKKQFKILQNETSRSHIYACFEQPETIQILKYISMPTPNKLLFDSGTKNINKSLAQDQKNISILKRVKEFRFQRIYNRQEKFKYAFTEQINHIIGQLFKGYSQAVFIYGTQESKKEKILIGESQNAGLLLTTLAEMFEYCHEKQIQDQVTIKISCSMFKDGNFTDPFNLSENRAAGNQTDNAKEDRQQNDIKNDDEEYENLMCEDSIEGKYLLGCPEIIIRNMRTALKIINLLTKKIQQRRDLKEQNTQNIIFTIKLQIDTAYDRNTTGEVYEYSIPKLYIVKLGNPSIDNTLNGINKNNQWFINLFNFLQNEVLQEKGTNGARKETESNCEKDNETIKAPTKELGEILLANGNGVSKNGQSDTFTPSEKNDVFTEYIKTVVMKGVADIHCFTSINNKMTSNECLTAFIFNNYLSSFVTKPTKTTLNMHHLKNQKANYEEQLMNIFTVREVQNAREKEICQKYRVKYNFFERQSSNGNGKVGAAKGLQNSASTTVFGKSFIQPQQKGTKANKQDTKTNLSTKLQRQAHSQSLKKHNSSQQPQQYLDPSTIRQTLRSIISFQSSSSPQQFSQTEEIEWQTKIYLLNYVQSVKQFMNCCNLLEYEYAQMLSHGCEKLNKYIFNEEIEEFYYAKKISLEHTLDLKLALQALKMQKLKISQIQNKINKKINISIKKVNTQLEALKSINGRQQHEEFFKFKKAKLLTMIKQRDTLTKIFEYYNTMSFHYMYEDNTKLLSNLQEAKKKIEEEFLKRVSKDNAVNYDEIMKNIKKGFNKRINQKRVVVGGQQEKSALLGSKTPGVEDEALDEDQEGNDALDEQTDPTCHQQQQKQREKWLNNSILSNSPSNALQNTRQSIMTIQQTSQFKPQSDQPSTLKTNSIFQDIKNKALRDKMKKKGDQLDNMFTNSNVGVVRPQFQRRNFNNSSTK